MHGEVFDEPLKLVAPRDEVSFAIDFDQNSNFAAHVNVRPDDPFGGDPSLTFLGGCKPRLTQKFNRLFFIAGPGPVPL
jgi:hypothetical protein